MVYENAQLYIAPGSETAFETAMSESLDRSGVPPAARVLS